MSKLIESKVFGDDSGCCFDDQREEKSSCYQESSP